MKILKFKNFIVEEIQLDDDQSADAIQYLYSLHEDDMTALVNDFIVADKESKKEYIEDIISFLKKHKISTGKIEWVEKNLKKRINKNA
jgi:uncharacterized protein YutE (UPF0331/DUF86 family)